jgi:transcription-repair coupling factor (superfamily II helicase)
MEREGDRVVYPGNRNAKPFERIGDFLELLDE